MTTTPDDHGGLITVMAAHEVSELAGYNSERAHGHHHTPAYHWRMAVLQWRFNAATREAALDSGMIPHPSGGYFGPHPAGSFRDYLGDHFGRTR